MHAGLAVHAAAHAASVTPAMVASAFGVIKDATVVAASTYPAVPAGGGLGGLGGGLGGLGGLLGGGGFVVFLPAADAVPKQAAKASSSTTTQRIPKLRGRGRQLAKQRAKVPEAAQARPQQRAAVALAARKSWKLLSLASCGLARVAAAGVAAYRHAHSEPSVTPVAEGVS